jgi:4-hydroxybutyrate dehydrogenase
VWDRTDTTCVQRVRKRNPASPLGAIFVIPTSAITVDAPHRRASELPDSAAPEGRDGREILPPSPVATFTFPNRILFGSGAYRLLGCELVRWAVKRPLIVTDPGVAASGIVALVAGPLGKQSVLYSGIQSNPTEADVLAGLELFQSAECDGLVAIGGGSAIDAAKAIRLLVTHSGALVEYDVTCGGQDKIRSSMPPLIALPTTAGTGSEAGRGTLIQLPQTGRKTAVLSEHLLPSSAICDPDLTRGLSPYLSAATGMDAFTHCIESYLSTTFHPMCDGIAVEGLRHVSKGLEPAVRDGTSTEARTAMMMGALLGGISFHKGLGLVHALSHALGSEGRVHHGTLNAILLPHVLRYNREIAAPRMADLGARIGLGRGGDVAGHLITLTQLLLARLPLPRRLGELGGLHRERIGEFARLAMLDHCQRTNPRPCTASDLEDILDRAW